MVKDLAGGGAHNVGKSREAASKFERLREVSQARGIAVGRKGGRPWARSCRCMSAEATGPTERLLIT